LNTRRVLTLETKRKYPQRREQAHTHTHTHTHTEADKDRTRVPRKDEKRERES
jgi:hypothetical protein